METLYIFLGSAVVVALLAYFLGKKSQKNKQNKANAKELKKDAKVDNRPDVDRDSLYKGLRNK